MITEDNRFAGSKILIVDDEESIRFTFRKFLNDEGYAASTAEDYVGAIKALKMASFDLVFVDIILGGKTGLDLLSKINEMAQETEVIIITGAPSVGTASTALRLGATDYIVKPVCQDALLRITSKALEHRKLKAAKEAYRLNLEAIFNSVRDAIVTVDNDMVVAEVNAAVGTLCGVRRDTARGVPVKDIIYQCSGVCSRALEQTLASGEMVRLSHVECASKKNPNQIVSVTATPLLKAGGTSIGGVMVIRDETPIVQLKKTLAESRRFSRIIGRSLGIRKVLSMIDALGDVQTSVLVTGESGTGKEMVADALHEAGSRRQANLVKVNCGALSEELLESELFGHVKGAFTGAHKDSVGRFQRADGGTLFLDEIGEMSPRMQVRFLRVLETMEFERVGESSPIKVDVRIVAATNLDLEEQMKKGLFREDLFFRLKVVEIPLPPLRERSEDIPLLVRFFLEKLNEKFARSVEGVSDGVIEIFMNHSWPGNVRQVENTLEHAFALGRRSIIGTMDLPSEFRARAERHVGGMVSGEEEILDALERAGQNKSEAARLLGISRRTLYRKLDEIS